MNLRIAGTSLILLLTLLAGGLSVAAAQETTEFERLKVGPFMLGMTVEEFRNVGILEGKPDPLELEFNIGLQAAELHRYLSERIIGGKFVFYKVSVDGPFQLAAMWFEYSFPNEVDFKEMITLYEKKHDRPTSTCHNDPLQSAQWFWGEDVAETPRKITGCAGTNKRYSLTIYTDARYPASYILVQEDNNLIQQYEKLKNSDPQQIEKKKLQTIDLD